MADPKQEETFRVIDRRPFTTEGELRQEFVAEQEREATREAKKEAAAAPQPPAQPANEGLAPAKETPKRSAAFENLIRMIGSNGAMVLGAYTDPRTGQPILDLEGARELIDMLDGLREVTRGNLASEDDRLLLDVLGSLKLSYMEMTKAAAKAMQEKAKARP